jgi:hypothetical protein
MSQRDSRLPSVVWGDSLKAVLIGFHDIPAALKHFRVARQIA